MRSVRSARHHTAAVAGVGAVDIDGIPETAAEADVPDKMQARMFAFHSLQQCFHHSELPPLALLLQLRLHHPGMEWCLCRHPIRLQQHHLEARPRPLLLESQTRPNLQTRPRK